MAQDEIFHVKTYATNIKRQDTNFNRQARKEENNQSYGTRNTGGDLIDCVFALTFGVKGMIYDCCCEAHR